METLLAITIGAGVILGATRMFPSLQSFMLSNRVRQKADQEARVTLETVRHVLSLGIPATQIISSPLNCPPNSDIKFTGSDKVTYEINCSPTGTVVLSSTPPATTHTVTLAENVTVFGFTPDSNNNPTSIYFGFESDTPLDSSGKVERLYVISEPAVITMGGS